MSARRVQEGASDHRIRAATAEDFAGIREVEHSTGIRYIDAGLPTIAEEPDPTDEELRPAQADGTLWVAEDGDGGIIGWVEARVVDGEGYVHQVSVRPEHERAGIGTALLTTVLEWARGSGLPGVALTTFRDVSFNAPWYARRGFVALGDEDLGPELAAIRAGERARGLEVAPRVAMRRSMLSFRPVARRDFEQLAAWARTPHVHRWWRHPLTVDEFEAEYGPCVDGTDPTEAFVVVSGTRDIGFIQAYRLADHPERERLLGVPGAVGIDYFIGDPASIGRGIGTRMVGEFVATVIRATSPDVMAVIADPEVANAASCRILEKNGFVRAKVLDGTFGDEQLMVLDLSATDPQTERSPQTSP
jgi:RimJ/RimL family protein N-acetyltransferase